MAIISESIEVVSCWHKGNPVLSIASSEHTYFVYDDNPFLLIHHLDNKSLSAINPKGALHKIGADEAKKHKLEGTWYKWVPFTKLAEDRSLGYCEVEIVGGIHLSCYLLPAKLVSVDQVLWMIRDIEKELRISPLWAPERDTGLRTFVESADGRSLFSHYERLFEDIEDECRSAALISIDQKKELGPRLLRTLPSQEECLQAAWARRRSTQLRECLTDICDDLEVIGSAIVSQWRRIRLDTLERDYSRCEALRKHGEVLLLKTNKSCRKDIEPLFTLTPSMQRDHRLRKLLRAFTPHRHDIWGFVEGPLSTLPPTKLPDLFEVWSAITMIRWLRQMGFRCEPVKKHSLHATNKLISASWSLRRGDISVIFDYEADPPRSTTIPPLVDRSVDALNWAAAQPDIGQGLFTIADQASPDFVIRVTGPKGYALAIGDATLADPDYTNASTAKPHKLNKYKNSLGWATDEELVKCHLFGAFAIYPGSDFIWSKLEPLAAELDCLLIYVEPIEGIPAPNERFSKMIDQLVDTVSS